MKKITTLFALAITLFTLNIALAQTSTSRPTQNSNYKVKGVKPFTKMTPEQKATQNADSLKVRLSLSEAQYQKVVGINTEYFKSRNELRKKMKSDTTAMSTSKEEMKQLFAARKKQINALLTPEQKKAWAVWHKENKANKMKDEKVKTNESDIDANEK